MNLARKFLNRINESNLSYDAPKFLVGDSKLTNGFISVVIDEDIEYKADQLFLFIAQLSHNAMRCNKVDPPYGKEDDEDFGNKYTRKQFQIRQMLEKYLKSKYPKFNKQLESLIDFLDTGSGYGYSPEEYKGIEKVINSVKDSVSKSKPEIPQDILSLDDKSQGDIYYTVREKDDQISVYASITFRRDTKSGAFSQYASQVKSFNNKLNELANKYKVALVNLNLCTETKCREADNRAESNGDDAYSEYEQSIGGGVTFSKSKLLNESKY